MVTTFPAIVATDMSELVYVIKPLLLVVGALILNCMFPNVFVIAEKLVRTVVTGFTVIVAVIVPDKKLVELD